MHSNLELVRLNERKEVGAKLDNLLARRAQGREYENARQRKRARDESLVLSNGITPPGKGRINM